MRPRISIRGSVRPSVRPSRVFFGFAKTRICDSARRQEGEGRGEWVMGAERGVEGPGEGSEGAGEGGDEGAGRI